MKRIHTVAVTALALSFFAVPAVSFAAALTQQQSSSLIAVVQSSPGTPASAFVSLITAFSNITVNQATSLITVVQAAPGVPASAFVDLLISFTVDTTTTQSATPAANQAVTPTATQSTTPTTSSTATTQPTNTSVAQCVDQPVFQYIPTVRQQDYPYVVPQSSSTLIVPIGDQILFNGQVVSFCTNKTLPIVVTTSPSLLLPDMIVTYGSTVRESAASPTVPAGSVFDMYPNNRVTATTTGYVVISAMGQSATTTITLLP